jgi:RNase P/RNase MRP subunit p29
LGHNVKGIFGTVQSEGEHTLSFYDAYGELVCTKQVSNSQIRLDTPKAVKIEITGDGSLIHIVPDFDLMTD